MALLCVLGTVVGEVVDRRNRKCEGEEAEAKRPETTKSEGYANAGFDDESSKIGPVNLEDCTVPSQAPTSEPPTSAGNFTQPAMSANGNEVDERHTLSANGKRSGRLLSLNWRLDFLSVHQADVRIVMAGQTQTNNKQKTVRVLFC